MTTIDKIEIAMIAIALIIAIIALYRVETLTLSTLRGR